MAASFSLPWRLLRRFAYQTAIFSDYSRGIVQDVDPTRIPAGGVYDAYNFLFDRPGVARKRGGGTYQSDAFGIAGETYAVYYADFSAGAKLVAVAPGGAAHAVRVYDATSGTSVDAGAGGSSSAQPPVLVSDKLVLIGGGTGGIPTKVTNVAGTLTPADLGGTPPVATRACAHLSHLLLAATVANPNRIYFSPIPNIESTWDTTNAYLDVTHNITALASLQGVLLAFSSRGVERIIGDTPPGTTGENMSLQPLASVGCPDPRAVVKVGDSVIFANQDGVYITNGASSPLSLTERKDGSGISTLWRTTMAAYTASTCILTCGTLGQDYLVVSLLSKDGSSRWVSALTLLCYLPNGSWTRLTGLNLEMFTQAVSGAPETYAADARVGRIQKLSGLLSPGAGNKLEADGATAIVPQLWLPPIVGGPNKKVFGHGHITYDMRDAASDNPTLAVSVAPGAEAVYTDPDLYAAVPESPLAEVTGSTRKRFLVNKQSRSISVKLVQSNASQKTEIREIEVEYRTFSPEMEGQ